MLPCFTFNVLVGWNLDVSRGKFNHMFLSLLYAKSIRKPVASYQHFFFNKECCFHQIKSLFFTTAKKCLKNKLKIEFKPLSTPTGRDTNDNRWY